MTSIALVKIKFSEEGFEILPDTDSKKGVDFTVGTYKIDVRTFDIYSTNRSIKILKSDWNYKLPDNLYVALVIYIEEG